jgi:hypothetical protein
MRVAALSVALLLAGASVAQQQRACATAPLLILLVVTFSDYCPSPGARTTTSRPAAISSPASAQAAQAPSFSAGPAACTACATQPTNTSTTRQPTAATSHACANPVTVCVLGDSYHRGA